MCDFHLVVVIASDGIKSLIRKHLYTRKNLDVSSQTAVYAEWIAWRGMIPVEKFKQVFGDKMDTKMMFFGLVSRGQYHGPLLVCLLTIVMVFRAPQDKHILVSRRSSTGPRFRVSHVPFLPSTDVPR